jgi:hypothetical protein
VEPTKRCPFCAEEILAAAKKCRFCQSDLLNTPAARPGVAVCRRCNVQVVASQERQLFSLGGCLGALLFLVGIVGCFTVIGFFAGLIFMALGVVVSAAGSKRTVMMCPVCRATGIATSSANVDPERESSIWLVRGVAIIAGTVFVVWLFASNHTLETNIGNPTTEYAHPPPDPTVSQDDFCKTIKQSIRDYQDAEQRGDNEVSLSSLRQERKEAIHSIIGSGELSEWIGVLNSVSTDRDQTARIAIQLPCGARVRTDFNGDGIPPSSPMYATIAKVREGARVQFNGEFQITGPNSKDWIREGSLTELGSMTDPEFIVSFTDINILKTPVRAHTAARAPRAAAESTTDFPMADPNPGAEPPQ